MPLSLDSFVQSKTGNFTASSGSATLDVGTTAESAVVICASFAIETTDTGTWTMNAPSGFTQVGGAESDTGGPLAVIKIFYKPNSAGGETSWTLSPLKDSVATSRQVVWAVYEVSGIGLDPLETNRAETTSYVRQSTDVSTVDSGTSPQTSCFDVLALAVHAANGAATAPAFSGQTNGFAELSEVSVTDGSQSVSMAVSFKTSLVLGGFGSTASLSPSAPASGDVVVFYADGAKHAPDVHALDGFEYGTTTQWTVRDLANQSVPPWDGAVGSPAIVTSNPRTGSYCLELSSSAAAECVTWATPGNIEVSPSTYALVERFHVYFPTSLPSADVELASAEAGSLNNGVTIWFRNATSKIGVKIGTGTEQVSDATVAADKWIGIDYRYDPRTTTHTCDWQVDYDSLDSTAGPVAQTQASTSGMTAANISTVRKGWSTSHTATVRYDDVVLVKGWGSYPLGDTRIALLKVDPAGTPTVSGTSSNFELITNNATGTAFSATGARDRVDEVPPVFGASADGIAQVTVATGDYVEFPMETFTAAPSNVLRALRVYLAGWAASGNPANIKYTLYDGTNTVGPVGGGDPGFANDTTGVIWETTMMRVSGFYLLTQGKLDNFVVRTGYSSDATPDAGFHVILAQVAYSPADVFLVSSAEDGAFKLWVRQDSISTAVESYLLDTLAATRGATLSWTINSVDGSQHIGPSLTYEKVIGADDVSGVTFVGMTPDP